MYQELRCIFCAITAMSMIALSLTGCGSSNPNQSGAGGGTGNATQSTSDATSVVAACSSTPGFSGGSGTSGNPYQISKLCDVVHIADTSYSGSDFILTKNLDLSTLDPIISIDFSGTFDGQGYSFSNWTGHGPLFVSNSGTIQNVNVTNFAITGYYRTAALVGTNESTGIITNCHVSAASLFSTVYYTGALVAMNEGQVTDSSATAISVNGAQYVGGLVGYNKGTIRTSSVAGTANTTSNAGPYVGGLTSYNSGTIQNSYASVQVMGSAQLGGLVGYNNGGAITNSYSSGLVSGTGANIGGLIGQATGGSVVSSYWDTTVSGQAASAGGTGQNTTQMQTQGTFAVWDFSSIWQIAASSYPTLR